MEFPIRESWSAFFSTEFCLKMKLTIDYILSAQSRVFSICFFFPFSHYICISWIPYPPWGACACHKYLKQFWYKKPNKHLQYFGIETGTCKSFFLQNATFSNWIDPLERRMHCSKGLLQNFNHNFHFNMCLQWKLYYTVPLFQKIMHCPVGTNILEKAWMLPKMQKMQHFKKYCNLQHVFPKTICSFNLKQPFWKGLRFLKWMLQYFKEYHNFWWKMFVKRNAATVQGVLCVVMNIFSKKCFRKECNFQLNPPSWKGHTFFKWNSMNMRRNFHKKNRFSEICLPEYVMYASGIFYIRRLFFFQIWIMSYFCPCSM